MPRREFLRRLGGGAAALGAGRILAGCGDGSAGTGFEPVAYRMFVSTFLAASVLEITPGPDGVARSRVFAQFDDVGARGPIETTAGLVVGTADNLFVFSPGSDQLFMLDLNTGARLRTIRGPWLRTAHDGAIGPDGLLYAVNAPSIAANVGEQTPDSVERFDPATGDHIDTFIDSNTTPEMRGPFGLAWGPDGDLYIISVLSYGFNPTTFPFRSDHIARFDGRTGEFRGFVVRAQHLTFTMAFHPNGHLLVPSHFFDRVYLYDGTRSKLIDAFVDIDFPIGVRWGPGGDLYVANFTDDDHIAPLTDADASNDRAAQGAGSIVRVKGDQGRIKETIISELPFAGYIAFA